MTGTDNENITASFLAHVEDKLFPCLAAHTALVKNHIQVKVAGHMGCPHGDEDIVSFLYEFIDQFRNAKDDFYSAVILFPDTHISDEEMFDRYFWQRLQAFADMDAKSYPFDPRVDADVHSPNFSFSLKEEAFYIIGGHPLSSRPARRFPVPGMVFNAHAQFEKLREENHYHKMQQVVRKRDVVYSASVNPMLADFGEASEVFQYSGRQYDKDWKCPLKIHHARTSNHSSP